MSLFRDLHVQAEPLLLGNVWDAYSAIQAEAAGYTALGTSSAAMSHSMGYEDGEQMTFTELTQRVRQIIKTSSLPLSVDIEAGYSRDPETILEYVVQLSEIGVVGINIEDSEVEGERKLKDANLFSHCLKSLTRTLKSKSIDVFVNVRCDAFLLNDISPLEEALYRAQLYESAGVDGLFFPGLTQVADIQRIRSVSALALNVMTLPDLPDFTTLAKAGVNRISTGNFAFEHMHQCLQSTLRSILSSGSCKVLFESS
jgi:2-methylisocitrate lyase-like PEP mutase family enzyme